VLCTRYGWATGFQKPVDTGLSWQEWPNRIKPVSETTNRLNRFFVFHILSGDLTLGSWIYWGGAG